MVYHVRYTVISIGVWIATKIVEKKNFEDDANTEIKVGGNFLLFAYVWLGCFFAANNTLFIKSVVTIVIGSITDKPPGSLKTNVTEWLSYVIIVLWIACLLLMEYWRQKALSHFGALYVVPTFSVIAITLTSIIGMVFFKEYPNSTLNWVLFIVGIIVTVIGVMILSFDIGKLWSELYDEIVKVSLVVYEESDYKYPKITCQGGPIAAYWQNRFYRRPAICYNPAYYDILNNAEQMIGKGSERELAHTKKNRVMSTSQQNNNNNV